MDYQEFTYRQLPDFLKYLYLVNTFRTTLFLIKEDENKKDTVVLYVFGLAIYGACPARNNFA